MSDAYCKNCGYLCSSRVTFSETCDECHTPVEWHDESALTSIEKLKQQNTELLAHVERLNKSVVGLCARFQDYFDSEDSDIEDSATLFSNANDAMIEALKMTKTPVDTSLQEHNRQVIFKMLADVKPTNFEFTRQKIEEYANNLIKER